MRFGGIVLVTLLTLGACSSDPEPREPERASTTTPTPTEAAPPMPEQATEDSPEGAAAFVLHYVDVFNHAAKTGDVEELSRLSSPDCEGCQRYITLYEDTYEAGGYFKGGDWKTGRIRMRYETPESFATTRVRSTTSKFKRSEADTEHTGAGTNAKITFAVKGLGAEKVITQLALGDVS